MSKSEREQREAEKKARRARRLSDRAEDRARRKADQATRATERAEELARRASRRRGPRDRALESSIEDYVDEVADKWTRKAEVWMDEQSSRLFDQAPKRKRSSYERSNGESSSYGGSAYEDPYHDSVDEDYDFSDDELEELEREESPRSSRRSRRGRKVDAWKKSMRRRVRSNRGLYRDKDHKRVCGVCAGLADYWNMDTWKVRFAAVMGLMFIPSVTIPGYFILYFLLDDKPYYRKASERYEDFHVQGDQGRDKHGEKGGTKPGRTRSGSKLSSAQAINKARQKFADIEGRVRSMEAHVTSSKFELQREFKKISGED